jgi:hypothetical protein
MPKKVVTNKSRLGGSPVRRPITDLSNSSSEEELVGKVVTRTTIAERERERQKAHSIINEPFREESKKLVLRRFAERATKIIKNGWGFHLKESISLMNILLHIILILNISIQ